MPDSGLIDNALVAKLGADATLLSYAQNGAYWENDGPPGMTLFVEVSLVDSNDWLMFEARAAEEVIYQVKAVFRSNAGATELAVRTAIRQAAARIDELLDPQPPAASATLTVSGYTLAIIERAEDFPRIHFTEIDEVDPRIKWFHRGAQYRVVMST